MKSARELMTRNPLCINLRDRVDKVASMFIHRNFKSLPVVDHNGVCIGMMTEFIMARAYISYYYTKHNEDMLIEDIKEILIQPMVVGPRVEIAEVLKQMGQSPLNRVLVADEGSKRLIGIISPQDILAFLIGEKSKKASLHEELETKKEEVQSMQKRMKNLEQDLYTYQSIYENSPYMIYSIDNNYKIVMANKNLHKALEYKPGSLIGRSVLDIFPSFYHKDLKSNIDLAMQEGEHPLMLAALVGKSKLGLPVDLISSVLRDEEGQFKCTITVCRKLKEEFLHKALEKFDSLQSPVG